LSVTSSGEIWEFAIEGGGLLARPDIKGLFCLNPTALEIWCQFRSGASPETTAGYLASAFGISFEVALGDVRATVDNWQQTLLAESTPGDAAFPAPCPPVDREIAIDCRLYGRPFRVLLSSRDLLDEIAPRLESLRVPSLDSPEITFRLVHTDMCVYIFRDDELVSVQEHPTYARVTLLQEIARFTSGREFLAILHAGACGSESKCVIFPAATQSGKTTLAAVLRGAGLTLYADDSVALDRQSLKVPAMPFGLMVREGSWPVISARFPGFENLPTYNRYGQNVKFLQPSGAVSNSAAQACAIVFSGWEPDAMTSISRLTSFDALVRLKESGFWLAHDRQSIQKFLDWLQQLPIYEMLYSDVDEAVGSVKELLNK
jgi:hypothetical protein